MQASAFQIGRGHPVQRLQGMQIHHAGILQHQVERIRPAGFPADIGLAACQAQDLFVQSFVFHGWTSQNPYIPIRRCAPRRDVA